MPELADLRNRTCIVGIGETAYTRGTKKSALELALEASISAVEDAGIKPEVIDAVILPGGAGSGGTAGDFIANLGLPDLRYTTSLQEMGGAMCVSAVESAAVALASGIANYALIPCCSRLLRPSCTADDFRYQYGNTVRRSYQRLLCAVRSIRPAATLRMDGPAPHASIRHHPRTIGSGSGGDAQACPVASERGNEGYTDGHG